jgi:hypothetical protein
MILDPDAAAEYDALDTFDEYFFGPTPARILFDDPDPRRRRFQIAESRRRIAERTEKVGGRPRAPRFGVARPNTPKL